MESDLSAEDVIELGIPNVFIATGASWRRDAVGRSNRRPLEITNSMPILTPDDIMAGKMPKNGPVVIYNDDQIYIGGVLAEHLAAAGHKVVFVTPASTVSPWTELTLEQKRIQNNLIERGVTIHTSQKLAAIGNTASPGLIADAVLPVTWQPETLRKAPKRPQGNCSGVKSFHCSNSA